MHRWKWINWTSSECQQHPYPVLPLDGHLVVAEEGYQRRPGKRDEGTGMDLGILGGRFSRHTIMIMFSDGGLVRKPA